MTGAEVPARPSVADAPQPLPRSEETRGPPAATIARPRFAAHCPPARTRGLFVALKAARAPGTLFGGRLESFSANGVAVRRDFRWRAGMRAQCRLLLGRLI